PPGLRADERKNQSEIPPLRSAQGRNDNRPLEELADGVDAASQNDRHNRVDRPEGARAEEASERAGLQDAGVSVDSPNRTLRNPSSQSVDKSYRGLPGDAESANAVTSRARFLAPLGMTTVTNGTLANDSSANGSLTNSSVTNASFSSRLGG